MTGPNAKTRRRHIHALTRRAEYLRQILKEDGDEQRSGRVYDIAELSALKPAIEVLTAHYAEVAQRHIEAEA